MPYDAAAALVYGAAILALVSLVALVAETLEARERYRDARREVAALRRFERDADAAAEALYRHRLRVELAAPEAVALGRAFRHIVEAQTRLGEAVAIGYRPHA